MKVSVVIPTGRTRERVAATIQSCVAQELPESFEVIVIANPPSPELEQWLDGVGVAGAEVRYIPCEVRSANVARNHGLEAARGEIVYFLDDDCRLPTVHHLRDLVRLHDQAPEVLGIGGPYRSPDAAPRSTVFYNAYTEMWLRRNGTPAGEQLVLAGGNASYKRRLGGDDLIFDDALAYGGTETEFNHRLVVRGHSLRLDDA
ncbi:MAG: glycosyltransferase family 2 protein, partial [Planctomycetes bacterium]|nr:glycosyltransferase family 2 protein [Planctomycetota bacterium]